MAFETSRLSNPVDETAICCDDRLGQPIWRRRYCRDRNMDILHWKKHGEGIYATQDPSIRERKWGQEGFKPNR